MQIKEENFEISFKISKPPVTWLSHISLPITESTQTIFRSIHIYFSHFSLFYDFENFLKPKNEKLVSHLLAICILCICTKIKQKFRRKAKDASIERPTEKNKQKKIIKIVSWLPKKRKRDRMRVLEFFYAHFYTDCINSEMRHLKRQNIHSKSSFFLSFKFHRAV